MNTAVDLDHYATVLKLVPGGEEELFDGTVREILSEFAQGRIGNPGGLSMRLAGSPGLILGVQIEALVEDFKKAL